MLPPTAGVREVGGKRARDVQRPGQRDEHPDGERGRGCGERRTALGARRAARQKAKKARITSAGHSLVSHARPSTRPTADRAGAKRTLASRSCRDRRPGRDAGAEADERPEDGIDVIGGAQAAADEGAAAVPGMERRRRERLGAAEKDPRQQVGAGDRPGAEHEARHAERELARTEEAHRAGQQPERERRLVQPEVRLRPSARPDVDQRPLDQRGDERMLHQVACDERVVALVPGAQPRVPGEIRAQHRRRRQHERERQHRPLAARGGDGPRRRQRRRQHARPAEPVHHRVERCRDVLSVPPRSRP